MAAILPMYQALRQAKLWRDVLWASILDDLRQRNPPAANAVREALAQRPALAYCGHSTISASWTWRYLDAQARRDWIWVCQFVQHTWIRGMREVTSASGEQR